MNNSILLSISMLFLLLISGCSLKPSSHYGAKNDVVIINSKKSDLSDAEKIRKQLYLQFKSWKGAPYSLGGLSKKGIDCSGFVYVTYREKFGLEIPRTTQFQSQSGKKIPRTDLRPGDLVFFRTGFKVRHVGIYLEDDKFVHASTKKGVMISTLNDYYWKDKYWHSRRIDL